MTTDQKRTAKNPRLETVGIGSDGWLSSLGSEQLAEHVERSSLGHAALLPTVDGALADSAQLAELACREAELSARSLDARRVVHNLASVVEDDGLTVGAGRVVDGDSHGSEFANDPAHDRIADNHLANQSASHHAITRNLNQVETSAGLTVTTRLLLGLKGAGALQTLLGRLVASPYVGPLKGLANYGRLVLYSVGNCLGDHAAKSAHNCAVSKRKLRKSAQCFVSRWSAQRCAVRFFKDNTAICHGRAQP